MERQIENRLEMLTRLHSTDMITQENRIMLPLQEEKNPQFCTGSLSWAWKDQENLVH